MTWCNTINVQCLCFLFLIYQYYLDVHSPAGQLSKQMKLNVDKTKNIIFNFSMNSQFTTDIELDGKVIETVKEIKLFGTENRKT